MSAIVNWLNGFSVQNTMVLIIVLFGFGSVAITTAAYYVVKVTGKLVYQLARMVYIYHLIRKHEIKRR